MANQNYPGPICGKCQERMACVSKKIVNSEPVQVFHCKTCDKYAAESTKPNNVVSTKSLTTGV